MPALNYHHLRYFWMVAREGSLRRAAERLHVSQPTISAQVHALEDALGEALLRRAGRGLALTDAGRRAFDYAEEIFGLGDELQRAIGAAGGARPMRLNVGVTDSLPKLVGHAILRPAFHLEQPVQVSCVEARAEELLVQLAALRLDLVLADEPAPSATHVRAFHHRLGESEVVFCAAPRVAASLRGRFPARVDGAPMLLPTPGNALRRSVEQWFERHGVRPRLVAEYDDVALMKMSASDGAGVVPLPTVIEREARERYGLVRVGRADGCRQEYFAISAERRLTHPGVVAITTAARRSLFARRARR